MNLSSASASSMRMAWAVLALGAASCAQLEHWKDVRVAVTGPGEVQVGKTVALAAETANGITERYRWRSEDESIATVDEQGRVTARSVGKATITATGAKSKQQGSLQLTVNAADAPGVPDAGRRVDAGRDAAIDAGARDALPPDGDDGGADDDAGVLDAAVDAAVDAGAPAPTFAEVHALLKLRCGACHITGGIAGGSNLVLVDDVPTDHETVLDLVDTVDPEESRLLAKARGDLAHGGGIILPRTADEYVTLRDWISAGAMP